MIGTKVPQLSAGTFTEARRFQLLKDAMYLETLAASTELGVGFFT